MARCYCKSGADRAIPSFWWLHSGRRSKGEERITSQLSKSLNRCSWGMLTSWCLKICCCAGEGASALLCVPAQTGLVTSGSHLDRLHATVGETTEMYEYQMDFLFFFFSVFFNGCSVIRGSDWDPPNTPSPAPDLSPTYWPLPLSSGHLNWRLRGESSPIPSDIALSCSSSLVSLESF